MTRSMPFMMLHGDACVLFHGKVHARDAIHSTS